jgi:hypothetical protein
MRLAFVLLFAFACGSGEVTVRKDVTSAECHSTSDCPGGRSCNRGICEDVNPTVRCHSDPECPTGQSCVSGFCEEPRGGRDSVPQVRR